MVTSSEFVTGAQGRMIEAVAALAEANRRMVGELIELSSQTARESLRTMGELQTATLETVQAMPMAGKSVEELSHDPFAIYRKGLQATAKLIETQAQIVTRNAERLQSSTERAAREIEQAATGYWSQLKDLYSR